MDNRGIFIKYTNAKMLDFLDEWGAGGDAEAVYDTLMTGRDGFTWVNISTENGLANGRATPTQIMSQLFTGEYQMSDGTSYFGTEGAATRMSGLYDVGFDTDKVTLGNIGHDLGQVDVNLNQLGSIFLSNLTTCYTIKATLAYLPSITGATDTDMYGFLNWHNGFKMTYDFDIYAYLENPSPAGLMLLFNDYDYSDTSSPEIEADEWRGVSGDSNYAEYSYWPPYDKGLDLSDQNASWERSQKNMPYDRNTDYHATTYSLEAVGMDFMDALTQKPEDATDIFGQTAGSAARMNHGITDPNYFMHSNILWCENRFYLSQIRFRVEDPYFSSDGATYISPLVDLSTNGRLVKLIKCRFTSKHSKQGFLSYDNGDVYNGYYQKTRYEGNIPSKDLWEPYYSRYGTHKWEKDCFTAAVEMMCDEIQAELEIAEYPKKLLNKVQKRGKLRDEQISAFGYTAVDESAYKLYLSQGGSAQPVTIGYTGEDLALDPTALSAGARTGESETGTYWGAESDMTWEEYIASGEFEGSK